MVVTAAGTAAAAAAATAALLAAAAAAAELAAAAGVAMLVLVCWWRWRQPVWCLGRLEDISSRSPIVENAVQKSDVYKATCQCPRMDLSLAKYVVELRCTGTL